MRGWEVRKFRRWEVERFRSWIIIATRIQFYDTFSTKLPNIPTSERLNFWTSQPLNLSNLWLKCIPSTDTIFHCILFPLYLAGLMVNISLRIYIENINILVLKQQDNWLNHESFCKYGYVARIIFPILLCFKFFWLHTKKRNFWNTN